MIFLINFVHIIAHDWQNIAELYHFVVKFARTLRANGLTLLPKDGPAGSHTFGGARHDPQ